MLDTGASKIFVNPTVLGHSGLQHEPAEAFLKLADDSEIPVIGSGNLIIFQTLLPLFLAFLVGMGTEFDAILGDSFLISLTRNGQRYTMEATAVHSGS